MSANDNYLITGVIVLALLGWLVWSFAPDKYKYSFQYGADFKNIHIDSRPSDCDWGHAPLGDKGCHYEKKVVTYTHGTDNATGRRVVSLDGGKTWEWDDGNIQKGTEVYVTWEKTGEN